MHQRLRPAETGRRRYMEKSLPQKGEDQEALPALGGLKRLGSIPSKHVRGERLPGPGNRRPRGERIDAPQAFVVGDPAPGRPLTLARRLPGRPEPSADPLPQLDDDPLRAADMQSR